MSSRTPWTGEELRQLKELAASNVSLNVISLKLGRSVAAVESKASQQCIQLRRMKRAYHRRAAPPQVEESRRRTG